MVALGVVIAGALALAVPQGNLLHNPGAEDGQPSQSGETTVTIPGWTTTGTFTVVPYGGGGAPDSTCSFRARRVALSRRCAATRHVTLTARIPAGLKARSATFRLAGRSTAAAPSATPSA